MKGEGVKGPRGGGVKGSHGAGFQHVAPVFNRCLLIDYPGPLGVRAQRERARRGRRVLVASTSRVSG